MTPTEIQLFAFYRAPVVPLDTISEKYLGLSERVARQYAMTNMLPFPTFRLTDSGKAPVMVKISDLAKHIDSAAEKAAESWEHSQV